MRLLSIVSISFSLVACGGALNKKKKAPTKPTHTADKEPTASGVSAVRKDSHPVFLGWYCPDAAAGRPALRPLMAKDTEWTADPKALAKAIGTRRARQLSVLAWQGHRAGAFAVAGLARDARGSMAIGSYLGSPPCQGPATVGEPGADDPVCLSQTHGCALAIGPMEAAGGFESRPYEEDPDRQEIAVASACEAESVLVMDTDLDGKPERFNISDLQTETDAPVELALAPTSSAQCLPNFAAPSSALGDLVRLAVIDVDGDGRPEVLYRRGAGEFLLYGAPSNPARLELLGRALLTSSPQ